MLTKIILKIKSHGEKIGKILARIKPHGNDIAIALIIIFTALISFGLGRLSKIRENKTPITVMNMIPAKISAGDTATPKSNSVAQKTGSLVASKKGSKYHYPWCSGALRIKDSNKIWFSSAKEARLAGYTPAKNCKGLK